MAATARIDRRPAVLSAVCAVLAVLLLAAGGLFLYLRVELLSADHFADRAVDALRHKEVRRAVAERIVTEAIDRGSPDLLTARPIIRSAVEVVIATPPFESLVRAAAREAHRILFDTKRPTVAVDLEDAQSLLIPALKSVDPQLARELPRRFDPTIVKLDERAFATDTLQAAREIRLLGLLLPFLGLGALAGAVLLAPDRRRALRLAPLAFTGAGALLLLVTVLARPEAAHAARGLPLDHIDAAGSAVWSAMVGDLQSWALWLGIAGIAVALFASTWADEVAAPIRAAMRALLAPAASRRVRALRGAALLAAGLVVLLASSDVVKSVGLVIAGLVAATGLADLIGAVAGAARPEPAQAPGDDDHSGRKVGAVVAAGVAVVLAVVVIASAGSENAKPRVKAGITSCNGMKELCGRRVSEVLFPGTHNSMSAADSPGWLFANQRRDIPHQLEDGIRLFLIDAHWGVRQRDGTVRTDLPAEGTNRNRVGKALGSPKAIGTAERLVGRVGLGNLKGKREVWLCHSLCELGATKMSVGLADYKKFLDAHTDQLLVLFIEPSVPSWAIKRELVNAGLFDRVAALARDKPMPTLGSLLRRGKQLVVLGERDTGTEPWYLDGFSYVQDTPLNATSCKKNRGDPTSPLFMVNHWIDGFPPRPSLNKPVETHARLLERIERCARTRGVRPALVAVDHYNLGAIVQVARELNRRWARG